MIFIETRDFNPTSRRRRRRVWRRVQRRHRKRRWRHRPTRHRRPGRSRAPPGGRGQMFRSYSSSMTRSTITILTTTATTA